MNHGTTYLACDLGADSGRVMLGYLASDRLELEELHRFANGPTRLFGTLRWDALRIFDELKVGLRKAASRGIRPAAFSVDSWGVDYVWHNAHEPQLAVPFHYRDARTDATFAAALEQAGRSRIFHATGIQFMALNTLYQLLDDVAARPGVLALADRFLCMADYFNYLFSGVPKAEVSLASTTQLWDPRRRQWSQELIDLFELPARLFPDVVPSGTVLGALRPEIAAETGLDASTQVVASCSHDTGAAVAAVPAQGDDWAYLSSGTWSLIGVELPAPLITDEVCSLNFTNETGFGNTTRFLKNIVGLWILQESRRAWARAGREWSFAELGQQAAAAEPLRSLIDPNDPRFLKPDDMPDKVRAFCRETGQPVPETEGQIVRCIVESLALLYRRSLADLQRLTGRTVRVLHVVGGGSRDALLNQCTADATGCRVLAGPVEATAVGNLLVQAIAHGQLGSIDALRAVVRSSFPVQPFEPKNTMVWDAAADRFAKLRAD